MPVEPSVPDEGTIDEEHLRRSTRPSQAKDWKAFDTAYNAVIKNCNTCHEGMGYGFIKVVKLKAPADPGIDYTIKSEPGDVPK